MAKKKEDQYGFEKAVLKVCTLREKNLWGPAHKAAKDPETGIVIKQKPAFFVIQDCANITKRYLFIMCYGSLTDPIGQLKGKVSVEDIEDFVGRSKNKADYETKQLFNLVFHDIADWTPSLSTNSGELENVYGDYEDLGNERLKEIEKLEEQEKTRIDLTNDQAVIDKLVEVFVLD